MTVRILMVDDEPDAELLFRQNFRREIRKAEYDFLFACSGAEALALLDRAAPPGVLVVLSDINMPGMTGMELLEEVKRGWPDMPVIMISAYDDAKTRAEAEARGAERLLPKPVDFTGLRRTLAGMSGDRPA